MMPRRIWRLFFLASVLMTLMAWGLMAFGVGIELIPEPDAPPGRRQGNSPMIGEVILLLMGAVGPLGIIVCGYLGWMRPAVRSEESRHH